MNDYDDIGRYVEKLEAENAELREALRDMLLLILEHGDARMKAHATRIGKAMKLIPLWD